MKKILKNNLSLILSFIIPILITILVLLITKIYPFGDKMLLAFDGYNQYPGFLNGLFESLKGNQSLFYSFKGSPTISNDLLYPCFSIFVARL